MNKRVWIPTLAAALVSLGLSGSALAADAAGKGLVLEPGTAGGSLQLHFAGADRVTTNKTGGLDIFRADGSVWHYQPKVYEVVNGKQRQVGVAYHVVDKDRVALKVPHADPSAVIVVGM